MFFRIKELELEKKEFNESYPPGAIDIGQDVQQKGDLKQSTPLLTSLCRCRPMSW